MVHSIIELLYNRVKYRVILFFYSKYRVKKQEYSIFHSIIELLYNRVNHWSKSTSIIELLYFKVKYRENYSVALEMVLVTTTH